jgi:hypothetical protein
MLIPCAARVEDGFYLYIQLAELHGLVAKPPRVQQAVGEQFQVEIVQKDVCAGYPAGYGPYQWRSQHCQ